MENSEKIVKVQGVFKHYDWGGKTFLPSLLHRSNEEGKPFAEYWMGSDLHAAAGNLPYLFKVQDVEKMLSIQVHPSREVAQRKFQEENDKGIPVNAPHRNYKDQNHKPELLSPLGDFYLLHGFRSAEQIHSILETEPELQPLQEVFARDDFRRLYTRVMIMPQGEVNKMLSPLIKRIVPEYNEGRLEKSDPSFWAARASLTFNTGGNIDRGIFSIYLFNIVHLQEGDALFQAAGLPHAYLEGQTMEIMANSDNVLRGGLTPKHIDVPELLENIAFEPTVPNVIRGTMGDTHEEVFQTPAHDFQLSRIIIKPHQGIALASMKPDIYFVYRGMGLAIADELNVPFRSGDALLVQPGTTAHFSTDSEAILYRAAMPLS